MVTRTPKPAPTIDPDDVLAELLLECRDGVRTCFELGSDPGWDDDRYCERGPLAARLMKISLAVAAALKMNPDFTHRIIVERVTSAPPPPKNYGKTIHGAQAEEDHKIG